MWIARNGKNKLSGFRERWLETAKEESSSKIGSRPRNSNHGKYYRIHKFPCKCQENIWFACDITEFNPKCLGGCTFPLISLMCINNLKNVMDRSLWPRPSTAYNKRGGSNHLRHLRYPSILKSYEQNQL